MSGMLRDRTEMDLKVTPSDRILGADVQGVDLSGVVTGRQFQAIEAALHEFGVLAIRKQQIDDSRQLAFSRLFGQELDIHPMLQFAKAQNPEVFILSNILENGKQIGAVDAAQYWHSDLCYTPHPSRVSILYAIEVPEQDGRTLGATEFASTAAAYEQLSDEWKRKLDGLRAIFVAQKPKKSSKSHFAKLDKDTAAKLDEVSHPIVRTHPFTGQKCLFVNEGFTTRVVGVSENESDDILSYLFAHMTKSEFIYRHAWAVGDVVLWDNCQTIHQGIGDYALPQRRLLYRTIVKGSAPF